MPRQIFSPQEKDGTQLGDCCRNAEHDHREDIPAFGYGKGQAEDAGAYDCLDDRGNSEEEICMQGGVLALLAPSATLYTLEVPFSSPLRSLGCRSASYSKPLKKDYWWASEGSISFSLSSDIDMFIFMGIKGIYRGGNRKEIK